MNKIELERKWLLKRMPKEIDSKGDYSREYFNQSINIEQIYTPDGWRYRRSYDPDVEYNDFTEPDYVYEKLKKVNVSKGVNNELEIQTITEEEWNEVEKKYLAGEKGYKSVSKTRSIKMVDALIMEFDVFDDVNIIILEVENVAIDQPIRFPPDIEELILMEVTGNPKFNNSNLAE